MVVISLVLQRVIDCFSLCGQGVFSVSIRFTCEASPHVEVVAFAEVAPTFATIFFAVNNNNNNNADECVSREVGVL